MAGLGWQELVIVLVIIMIIFGAGKLPEIAKSLGQGVKEFREEAQRTSGAGNDEDHRRPRRRQRCAQMPMARAWRLERRSTGPVRRCGLKRFAQRRPHATRSSCFCRVVR